MNQYSAQPRTRLAPPCFFLLALLAGAAARAVPPEPIDRGLLSAPIEPVKAATALLAPALNLIPSAPPADVAVQKSAEKTVEAILGRRWLQLREDVRGSSIEIDQRQIPRFSRYFPHSRFFRLVARREGVERVGYASLTMGQLLVLPEEMNLLLVLENRPLNRHNVRQLSEIIVRMAEPEGITTMNVIRNAVHRDPRSREIDQVVLESWSYGSRQKKRWTIGIQASALYSLEEKQLSYRPRVADALTPLDVDPTQVGPYGIELFEDEIEGPTVGDERYIAFWRDPALRRKMQKIRAEWLRSEEDPAE